MTRESINDGHPGTRALLYVRVSSKGQEKEGFSLDAQEKLGHDYARRNGLQIVRRWKVSESAWKQERAAFNQMIDYARRHIEVKHIIFDVTDRMTRNDFDKLKIYTLIKEYNKTVHFSRSNKVFDKDSGPDDEFMLDIEVAVAKKMSSDISRKTKMGLLEKAEQGQYPSVAPTGYRNNLVTHLLDVDEETAPLVRRTFSLMASGSHSLNTLADALHREGFRTKTGHRVSRSSLELLLKNPIYYGVFRWRGQLYEGTHTPLVSKELFDRARDVLNGRFHPSLQKRNFPFNNLVICGICNCKVLGERKKDRYSYYHCTFSKGRHPGVSYIREEKLATMFEEPIRGVTLTEDIADWLAEALKQSSRRSLELHERRLSTLRNEYNRVNTRLSRLYDAKFDGEIDEDMFLAKEGEYRAQLIEVKTQIDSTEVVNPDFYQDGRRILELSKRLYSLYLRANYEEKARILKVIASNYTLDGQTLYPTYRKPFDILAEGRSCPGWLPGPDSNQQPSG